MFHLIAIASVALLSAFPAYAQNFYAGKTVTIITSTGPGGTYDLIARLAATYMPRYLPGAPTMIVQNMPGAGHVLATNYMYSIAPKDGTAIATVNSSIPLNQALGGQGVRYDAGKFNWIGSTGSENSVVYVWAATGVKTMDDAKKRQVILGATGADSSSIMYAMLMNNLIGTKFKTVIGYKSLAELLVAITKGEVEASTNGYSAIARYQDWRSAKKVNFIAQIGYERDKHISDVPLLTELVSNDDDREIMRLSSSPSALGQIYLAPPGVPSDRIKMLREAFSAALKDSAFLAETKKADLNIEQPISGEELAKLVNEITQAPSGIIEKTKTAAMPAHK
jgi:tripartite-type tricarboxylate transporter receptor subunit TctC